MNLSSGHCSGGAFNHHHFALVAYVDEVEGGVEHLLVRGVDDEFAVYFADSDAADRAVPRYVGNEERGGGAVDHEDVGVVYHVCRQQQADDLHFVHEALGEERAQGPVAEARG